MSSNLISFDESSELVEELSSQIAMILKREILRKGYATILLSGGSTPKKLFEKLSDYSLDWSNVKVGLVDERVVATDSLDSNENLVKTYLFQNKAKNAQFINMENQKDLFPFDVIVLGMGNDAHTASLFPNNEKLKEAFETKELIINITPAFAPYDRISSTLYAIKNCQHLFLYIEGEQKFEVLQKALKNDDYFSMPISAVLNDKDIQVEVYHT